MRLPWLWTSVALLVACNITIFAPLDKTLGGNSRIVYLHGAAIWTALLTFLAAAASGMIGLLTHRQDLHQWSRALGRSGLTCWVGNLLLSLYVMQANWNGLFLAEPRFRIPLNFAIAGLLLQSGLSFFPDIRWTSLANIGFGLALFVNMSQAQAILHPESPILKSGSPEIQIFFLILTACLLLAAWQLTCWWNTPQNLRA